MKLSEEVEPRLEVVAKEPRLEVREPRLLPDEQDRVLADRLQEEKKEKSSKIKTTDGTSLTPPLQPVNYGRCSQKVEDPRSHVLKRSPALTSFLILEEFHLFLKTPQYERAAESAAKQREVVRGSPPSSRLHPVSEDETSPKQRPTF